MPGRRWAMRAAGAGSLQLGLKGVDAFCAYKRQRARRVFGDRRLACFVEPGTRGGVRHGRVRGLLVVFGYTEGGEIELLTRCSVGVLVEFYVPVFMGWIRKSTVD